MPDRGLLPAERNLHARPPEICEAPDARAVQARNDHHQTGGGEVLGAEPHPLQSLELVPADGHQTATGDPVLQDSCAIRCRGHNSRCALGAGIAPSFVVDEEERAIPDQGSS